MAGGSEKEGIPHLAGFVAGNTVLTGYWKMWENLALEIKKTNQRKNKN